MKLWLLTAKESLPEGDDPWEPWYDKSFGCVVRAKTEIDAREIAHESAGDENRNEFFGKPVAKTNQPWKEAKYSSCVELTNKGEQGLILQDFRSA